MVVEGALQNDAPDKAEMSTYWARLSTWMLGESPRIQKPGPHPQSLHLNWPRMGPGTSTFFLSAPV